MDKLNRSLHRFEGLVPVPGYELIEIEGETLLSLEGGKPLGIEYVYSKYDLFQEYPVLFRDFAFLDLKPHGVLEFAQKYGSLGEFESETSRNFKTYESNTFQEQHIKTIDNVFYFWLDYQKREGSKKHLCRAERLEHWYTEAQQLRLCLMLWELLSSGDTKELDQHLKRKDDLLEIRMPFVSPNLSLLASSIHSNYDPVIQRVDIEETPYPVLKVGFDLEFFPEDEPTEMALYFVEVMTNSHLALTTPIASLQLSPRRFEITVQPRTFLGALWFQFAQALDGRKGYNVCAHCGSWFDIGKWGSRRDKKFCSGKCRQAAYDTRQKREKLEPDVINRLSI